MLEIFDYTPIGLALIESTIAIGLILIVVQIINQLLIEPIRKFFNW